MIGCGKKIYHEIEERETICNEDHFCDECHKKINGNDGDTKKAILEVMDDDLVEKKQEIADKKQEIKDKEKEIEENEDFEMDDDELDDHIDSCYDKVEIMGDEYPMSEVIKGVNEGQYEDLRDDFTRNQVDEKRDELEGELDDLKEELEELEENYEEEFENED